MPAALPVRSPRLRSRSLIASACLVSALAWGAAPSPLALQLAEIREVNRFTPERALPMLLAIEAQGRTAPLLERAEFLAQMCSAYRAVNRFEQATALCDELIALGRKHNEPVSIAKGLLHKGYVEFSLNNLPESHRLVWEAEKLANTTSNIELRVRATISSGESYAEDGNFPMALQRLQAAASLARQHGDPVQVVMALNALATLYWQMREYEKGFGILAEAAQAAEQTNSPGRVATLKNTEYLLAMGAGQHQRALKALLAGLALQRQIGAESLTAYSLVNLSDCYLKLRDYPNAADYALKTIAAAREQRDDALEATARLNLGQAYIGMGRLGEGKRQMEAGLATYEKAGDKPELQAALAEYGSALERAGDLDGAVAAYHRERKLSNELFERRRQKAMLELQEKYETDRKQREIELLRRENRIKSTEIDNRRLQQRVWWLLALVFALASVVVGILYRKVRQANARLKEKNLELKQQSVRDPLTGLYNRRHFQEFMREHAHGKAVPDGDTVGALFLIDVDQFKQINDTFGHAAGDVVLGAIANNLREILRETDMIVRWGGEEFLAFLPALPKNGLDEVARRLLTGVAAQRIECQGSRLSATVSIGFAPFPLAPAGQALPWERAVNLVDMALYLAKSHGRNRAYGVRGFTDYARTSMEEIEQNLEQAWRDGFVDLSVVTGAWHDARASA
jgi:diguanylate cyclase (GGDEF)-like protein